MRLLDRYILREILPPFAIALVVFTFVLIIPFMIEMAEELIAKGVETPTLLRVMVTLLPQALGLTIPMAFLLGILVAFGRLSGDREVVVLMACGVSPYRMLRPVLLLALLCWAATSWVMIEAIPDENQRYREITARIVADRAEGQVRPREFFDDFPDTVLYVSEVPRAGGWERVFAADTKNAAHPVIFMARRGRVIVNRQAETIDMVLEEGVRHSTNPTEPATYEIGEFKETALGRDPRTVFPREGPARGSRELTIPELQALIAQFQAEGISPHREVMEIHKKFTIPIACFVFAVLGVALGVSNRRDGKLASFVLGIGVIFAYYVVMFTAESMTKGKLMPSWLAMWIPNIVLGAAAALLIVSRARGDRLLRIPLPSMLLGWFRRRATVEEEEPRLALSPNAKRGVVLVVKLPHLNLPRPHLLDLYVSRIYLRILGLCSLGILGLFYISTFIDLSDKLFKGEATLGMILAYLGWYTPQLISWIFAIAVLLSALVTIGLLTKSSELIVMRACGVSLYRTAMPLLFFAAIASAMLFLFEERVLAVTNRRAEYLQHLIRGGSPQTFDVLHRRWIVGRKGEIYHYQFFDPRKQELNALSVYEFDPKTHMLARRTFALAASYAPRVPSGDQSAWIARNGWIREFSGTNITKYTPFETARLPLESADYFVTEAPEPDWMNYRQLQRYIDELKASGYDVLKYEVALHHKFAFPFVTIIMTFIAVPFAVTTGRRGALYGVGVGIVLALVYWTMISVFKAFGAAGLVDPMLAAWAPNVLFFASAAYLLLTVRT